MTLTEKELDQIILNQLSKELASNIEVPDIDNQWQQIKKLILEDDNRTILNKTFKNHKRLAFAAAILISIGSLTFVCCIMK